MKRTYVRTLIALSALIGMVLSCQQPGGGGAPFAVNPSINDVPQKRLMTNSRLVNMICYVDTATDNPLNAKDYYFNASRSGAETPFFNYVVLAYAYLVKNGQGYTTVELTPALRYVLDNAKTLIKPLRQKGIKVLVEVRSGNFTETEDGQRAGLGAMDMAAINEFTSELKNLVDHYGIDGFDFNDIGGGKNSYPPHSRGLTQFQSATPLYPDSVFKDQNGDDLGPAAAQERLWREGGSNFSNLIQRLNELLKENFSWEENVDGVTNTITRSQERFIMVRAVNHGKYLVHKIRDEYMVDAYTGANVMTMGNLNYVTNDRPYNYDAENLHPHLYDESTVGGRYTPPDVGKDIADSQYAPFTINLRDHKDKDTAELWARRFIYIDPDAGNTDVNYNVYGALTFSNLGPASEHNHAAYLTYFSNILFGRVTNCVAGGGNYQKSW